MRVMFFLRLMVVALVISLLAFGITDISIIDTLKIFALGTVASIAVTAFYPEMRGVKQGDTVSVVADRAVPSLIGRLGRAMNSGRKNEQIKIVLPNGSEITGVIEDYGGLISHPKIRIIYEEKLVE